MSLSLGLYITLDKLLLAEAITDEERVNLVSNDGSARAIFVHELYLSRDFSAVIIEHANLGLETARRGAAKKNLDSKVRELRRLRLISICLIIDS